MSSPSIAQTASEAKPALEESVGYLVRNAFRAYDRVLAERLAKHHILTAQWSLLRVLWQEENLSQTEAAKRVRVERATLTHLLHAMEKNGLLTRAPDPTDNRKQLVRLTPKGRRMQQVLLPIGRRVNGDALVGFSQKEIATLRALLARVISNLER